MKSCFTLVMAASLLAAGSLARADDTAPAAAGDSATVARPHHVFLVGPLRLTRLYLDPSPTDPSVVTASMVIDNHSGAPDRLLGADFGAQPATLIGPDGASTREGLTVPPEATLTLKPGEVRLEASGLGPLPSDGRRIAATLRFERAGAVPVSFATEHASGEDDGNASDDNRNSTLGQ